RPLATRSSLPRRRRGPARVVSANAPDAPSARAVVPRRAPARRPPWKEERSSMLRWPWPVVLNGSIRPKYGCCGRQTQYSKSTKLSKPAKTLDCNSRVTATSYRPDPCGGVGAEGLVVRRRKRDERDCRDAEPDQAGGPRERGPGRGAAR